jgi:hypothetical protein
MKALRVILLLIVAVIVICLGLAAMRPDTYHFERSASIAAPPSTVFAVVDDFHNWSAWSPWAHLDPAMKESYEGPSSGKDAIYSWTGNDKVGTGRMTIQESTPDSHVGIKLEFIKPMAMTAQSAFALAPEGQGTKITWSMDGKNDFMAKFFSLFMNMDKSVGGDFERGLASLKTIAEKMPAASAAADTTKKG